MEEIAETKFYRCHYCDKRYTDRSARLRHEGKKHREELQIHRAGKALIRHDRHIQKVTALKKIMDDHQGLEFYLHRSNALNIILDFSILRTVNQLIELFVDNAPECSYHYQITTEYGGGGGKDYDTMEYSLRLFYHLILAYNEAKIIKHMWTSQNKDRRLFYTSKRTNQNGEVMDLDEWSQSSDTEEDKEEEPLRTKVAKVPEEVYILNEIADARFLNILTELQDKLQRLLKYPYQTEENDEMRISTTVMKPRFIPKNIILLAELLSVVLP
jgi:hypothetical protein